MSNTENVLRKINLVGIFGCKLNKVCDELRNNILKKLGKYPRDHFRYPKFQKLFKDVSDVQCQTKIYDI